MRHDFRFVEFEQELNFHGGYIDMVAEHMGAIVETERKRIHALYADDADGERAGLEFMEHDLDQGTSTRSFGAAAIVGLWAIYESSVVAVAAAGKRARSVQLGIDQLSGTFLERATRYFSDVLRFQVHDDSALQALRELQALRNAYAHGHGRINAVNKGQQKAIRSIVRRRAGVRSADEILIVDVEAARDYYRIVDRELRDLFKRARAEF